ncbi:hypothetical protein E2320_005055 [Naja naja]|nr:hypothetical protein E2320_005055 [Naja naja]
MVGVHQGSALPPLLFILVMDTIMHDLQQNAPWTMLYADDVMLASTIRGELQQQVQTWNERLNHFGFRLNIKKTEYLETVTTPGMLQINGENLKKLDIFWYLGSHL